MNDKKSSSFHHFLTPDQWNARFAPAAGDEQAVASWAQAQGFTVTRRYANRLIVDVEAPVSVIEQALGVKINSYQLDGTAFFSNDRDPSLPASLSGILHSVQGLNNAQALHPMHPGAQWESGPVYAAGPVAAPGKNQHSDGDLSKRPKSSHAREHLTPHITNGSYDPSDIFSSNAYNYDGLDNLAHCCNPLNHAGGSPPEASIAIATSGDFDTNDISAFVTQYGLANNITPVTVDGTPACCNAVTTMEVEWAIATSNSFETYLNTAHVWVYEGANTSLSTFTDVYNQILSDGNARVMSTSWGCAELLCTDQNTMDTDDAIFSQMIGQGWTIVAASDDNGATAENASGQCATQDAVSFPASDPNVVAAGGTTLDLDANSFYVSEIGWIGNTSPGSCASGHGGSGGGISAYYDAPSYQAG